MKVKDFLCLCTSRRIPRFISKPDKNLDNYKAITEYFSYPCDFDKYGRCSIYKSPMGCCNNCAVNVGCLDNIRLVGNVKQISEMTKKYARFYDGETGFWRKSKGCVLPRNMRSTGCVGFICFEGRKKFELINGKSITRFLELLKNYNHLSKKEKHILHQLYIKICNKQKIKEGKI
jgi:hypothetical protein